jgi:hypothetical protein
MKPPEFLKVQPADVGRVGALGAVILAAVRYMTGLPGEANGRRVVDGETWWRASHADIAAAVGGGVSRRTVSATVKAMLEAGDLVSMPAESFYGDRAQAYRASDQPLAETDQGPDRPLAETDQCIGKIRPSGSARFDQAAGQDSTNLPSTGELKDPSGRKNARTARGTRLDPSWIPPQDVIDAMRVECPTVDLQAEHRRFIDYWTDQTGAKATKMSWVGTWRNWIRKEAAYRQSHGPRQGVSTSDQRAAQTQALKTTRPRLELL